MIPLRDIKNPQAYIYSDLYKDVNGCRPRDVFFESEEAFAAQFADLVQTLDEQLEAEAEYKKQALARFVSRVNDIQAIMPTASLRRIVDLIGGAECGESYYADYGFEALEYELGLGFGDIAKFLNAGGPAVNYDDVIAAWLVDV